MSRVYGNRVYVYAPAAPAPRSGLPPQRARVLAFIRSQVAAGKRFPHARTIADHMGWRNAGSARQVLDLLVADGFLVKKYDRASGGDARLRVRFDLVET